MIITKRFSRKLDKAYATAIMEVNGETNYLVATEGYGPCIAFNENTWKESDVWPGPGGTMNIVPIPGRKNEFIATQDFTPTFQAKESKIVHAKCDSDSKWTIRPIMTIPYLHRFDVFVLNNKLFLIGATLCEDKDSKEDWSKPGKVYVAEIPPEICKPFALKPILEGITKNHGFCRGKWNNRDVYLISGSEGVFALYLPEKDSEVWESEQLLNHEVSDIAVFDIDNDGHMELATIESFHGSRGIIYKSIDGKLIPIHEHAYEFGHVVWGGKILNKPSFIIGGRKGNRELNCFQMDDDSGKIKHFTIDNTGGPSNIAVLNKKTSDVILAANREIGEVAIYEITE
ncbi:hypothetical protein [Pelosinus sp. UFO1]|uniref:hypothetical protein n=1 Tax=Pelosinus sp. UFO1 TaxID=484770 RepID=UPI0004D0C9CF|nr:hypothetical protein [Pelosinus sp. UFO1]AIF50326.1 hypothetical protein UFO1_0771 [Pelosinus sp. UFO1]